MTTPKHTDALPALLPCPFVELNGDGTPYSQSPGMTLRDYFAAKAMQSLLVVDGSVHFDSRAREAYQVADEMLKARAAGNTEGKG